MWGTLLQAIGLRFTGFVNGKGTGGDLMQGVPKCNGCGHDIRQPDGFLTRYKGKRYHVGCLEAYLHHKKKTLELLKKVKKAR